jgi:hypothetical protein
VAGLCSNLPDWPYMFAAMEGLAVQIRTLMERAMISEDRRHEARWNQRVHGFDPAFGTNDPFTGKDIKTGKTAWEASSDKPDIEK